MSVFKNIALVIVSPKYGWEEINKSGVTTERLLVSGFYPMLALLAISCFVPMFYDTTISLVTSLLRGSIAFVSYFFTYMLSSYLLGGFYPELVRSHSSNERLNDYLLYNLIYLVVLQIITNLMPSNFTLLNFMIVYMVVLALKGVEYLGLDKQKVNKFLIFSCALMLVMPWLIKEVLSLIFIH